MNDLVTIRGVVESFERSTHTSRPSDRITTTHLSLFKLGSRRVLLKTATPSVISNGDEVVIAGMELNGQFQALACKNLTANWLSPLQQQGCAFVGFIAVSVVSFLLFFMIIPIIMGCACLFFAYKVKKHDNLLKEAHSMVEYARKEQDTTSYSLPAE